MIEASIFDRSLRSGGQVSKNESRPWWRSAVRKLFKTISMDLGIVNDLVNFEFSNLIFQLYIFSFFFSFFLLHDH